MTDPAVQIRDGVYAALSSTSFDIGMVDIEKTYFPQENIEDLAAHPKIKVVGFYLGADRLREYRKSPAYLLDLPVQICIQQRVDPTDTSHIDDLHRLITQVLDAIEDDNLVAGANFSWSRTEPLKDENGLIYSYEQMSQQHVFQVIFTAHYNYVHEAGD